MADRIIQTERPIRADSDSLGAVPDSSTRIPEDDLEGISYRTHRPKNTGRSSAILGSRLIDLTVTGTVLVAFLYLWWGQYVLAAALLIPLATTIGWYGAESILWTEKPIFNDS